MSDTFPEEERAESTFLPEGFVLSLSWGVLFFLSESAMSDPSSFQAGLGLEYSVFIFATSLLSDSEKAKFDDGTFI